MIYRIAERFKSLQGEGVYTGTPMAFLRFVGCSVGKKICQHCDTDFDTVMPWRGGGNFEEDEIVAWAEGYRHIVFTGGEPLDQDLEDLLVALFERQGKTTIHVETSGTIDLKPFIQTVSIAAGGTRDYETSWICVSPKPGWLEESILWADEVKVIVPGLGINPPAGTRWPDLQDALRWAQTGKLVFIQPRNAKNDIDYINLMYCQDIMREHTELRLSVQLHKILKVQ